MITKDGRDVSIGALTADNYVVPKGEEGYYHCVIEVVHYDSKTGNKLSKPRVQKFGKKTFETTVQSSLRKQGFTVTILHDPTEWMKEQKAKAAEAAEARAKKAEETKAAEKAAMKAEIIAELKAAGVIADEKKAGRPKKEQ